MDLTTVVKEGCALKMLKIPSPWHVCIYLSNENVLNKTAYDRSHELDANKEYVLRNINVLVVRI